MKQCAICQVGVNEKVDKWVKIEDYQGKTKTNECYLHYVCWKDMYKIKAKRAMKTATQGVTQIIPSLIKSIREQFEQ